jgi:hypothetical protein
MPKRLLEFLSLLQRLLPAFGIHHGVKMTLGLDLLFLAHRVHDVEHLMIPAELPLGLGIDFSNRCPQSEVAVANKEPGALNPSHFHLPQH